VARHRSPKGRRAHLGPPLSAVMAAAGVGACRSIPVPQPTSLPARFVAAVVAGGALAAAGQQALAETVPLATDGGTNLLKLVASELVGGSSAAPSDVHADVRAEVPLAVVAPLVAESPVDAAAAEPVVADAASLVKAADLQRAAAEAATRAAQEAAQKAAATEAAAAEAAAATEAAATKAAGNAEAAAPADQGVVASVAGAVQMITGRVTSGFGARWGSAHQGLDIAAPIGTPIRVPLAGTVISSGPASGFGLWVRVRHADGTVTVYGHINRSLVRVGEQVEAGQEIAEVGNRGQSTGPHLHIEVVTPGGTKINPRPWLDEHGVGY
jgi:murein DD-endopeptidase MepM/ murein hydrolase activator NlpD